MIPGTFAFDRFVAMLDAFFATDHYKLIINKTFTMTFNSSRAFVRPLHVLLFSSFLLGRRFHPLCDRSFDVPHPLDRLFRTTILRRSHLNRARNDAEESRQSTGVTRRGSTSRAVRVQRVRLDCVELGGCSFSAASM